MIKKTCKLLPFLVLSALSYDNTYAQNCVESMAEEYIQNAEMKILFRNGGDMFWDGTGQAQYAVPYVYGAPETNPVFAAATWMGGYDAGGNLKVAAQTYRSNGNDYWAGPIDNASGTPFDCNGFDHIWKVQRFSIEQHLADYNDNGIIDGPTDLSLLKWPGKDNPNFLAQMGFPLPVNQDLAPFYDQNSDGIYNPLDGDYPVFEDGNSSAIAEEILWSVFNDIGNLHTQSNGQPLRVEVQQTAYLFSCTNDPLINKTLFIKHKIYNRSLTKLYDYYYGVWADFDMGCANDDYVGTIPSKNTIYAYNQDNNDDNPCGTGGSNGYGTNPPVQAMTILNHSLSGSMYHINSSADPKGGPSSALGYYRLLSGKFANGVPLSPGGDGYDPANPLTTRYMFPDNPNNGAGWSMVSENLSGLDQRIVGSIYKDSFDIGEILTVDIAYSYHRDPDSNHLQNVNLMEQQVDLVQQYYDNNFALAGCIAPVYCTANCVFPGDANNNGIDNDFDFLEIGLNYGASAVGRSTITGDWYPYLPPSPITNAYVDANGDNTVDLLDIRINTDNWKRTHTLYTGVAEGVNTIGTDLFFERYYNFSPVPIFPPTDTIVELNRYAVLDVNFGSAGLPITDLHGVTFRVTYDETVLNLNLSSSGVPGLGMTDLNKGWLGDDGATVYSRMILESGTMNYVGTRINQVNYTGNGNMGRLIFRVDANAFVNASTMSTDVCFEDFKAIRADGTTISIGAQCATILYRDPNFIGTSIQTVQVATPKVDIYPNPTDHLLNVDLGTERANTIQLFNVLGEAVYAAENITGLLKIEKNNLAQGMYTIVIHFENGTRSSHKVLFH